jgi:hypothetical protein
MAWFLGSRAARHGPFGQTVNDVGVGELVAGRCVGQTFEAHNAGLYRVDLWLANFARANQGPLVLHVRPAWFAADWVAVEIDMAGVQDNAYQTYEFEPLPLPAGVPAFFCLEAPTASPGNAVMVGGNSADAFLAGRAMLGTGASVEGAADLKFQLYYRPGAPLAAEDVLRRVAQGKPGWLALPAFYHLILAGVSAILGALGWAVGRAASQPNTGQE